MDKNLETNNMFFWADVVGTARYIINTTAPDDKCYMSQNSIDIFKKIAELTPLQILYIAKAIEEADTLEAVYLMGDKHAVSTLLKKEGRV